MQHAKISSNMVLLSLNERKSLPVFPTVIAKLDEVLNQPHANIEQVLNVVSTDMIIASRIMRSASSARYGMKPPKDLQDAIQRLGFAEVRAVAFAVSYISGFTKPKHIVPTVFWQHAFASAVAARELSIWFTTVKHKRICDAPTAFLLGLSHDIGILLLDLFSPCDFGEVFEQVDFEDQNLLEQRLLGTTHAIIGAALLKQWGFADHIAMAIAAHHFPARLQPDLQPLADVLLFAEIIAARLGYPNGVYKEPSKMMTELVAHRCKLDDISEADFLLLSQNIQTCLESEGWLELTDSLQ